MGPAGTLILCPDGRRVTHVHLQQIEHARLSNFFRLVELLQSLTDLLIWDLALSFLLIIKVQAPALQLL